MQRARDDITKFGRNPLARFPLERRYKRITMGTPRKCRYEFRVFPSLDRAILYWILKRRGNKGKGNTIPFT